MFSIPRDPELAKLWLMACYRSDLLRKIPFHKTSYKLCHLHFEDKFLIKGGLRKRLFKNAVPSIFPARLSQVTEISIAQNERQKIYILSCLCVELFKQFVIPVLHQQQIHEFVGLSSRSNLTSVKHKFDLKLLFYIYQT
nr:unnamed protein product [Callosobruchus analis]